jgi:hypothetical protein
LPDRTLQYDLQGEREVLVRSRIAAVSFSLYLAFVMLGCSSKPATDASSDPAAPAPLVSDSNTGKESQEAKREPIVIPAGTAVTISLGSSIGSRLSQAGQSFSGSIAKSVVVNNAVAIPRGSNVTGTVTDAKPLGKLAGGAVLQVRLDSIHIHGAEVPVQTTARTFTEKGKGKRTAVMTGGGAALGGIVGALAGGGKGAAIGLAAGGGAGVGGAALTGNKEIVLAAESNVTFELSKRLEVRQ